MLPEAVLAAWNLDPASVRPLGHGLINRTFLAATRDREDRVVQQVNRLFPAEVNQDIDRVTRHLVAAGLSTPRIVPTLGGSLWLDDPEGAWRALTYVPGRSLDKVENPQQARAAGRLLGRFHLALADYDQAFASRRPPIHDLGRHLAALESALEAHSDHPDRALIAPVASAVFEAARRLEPLAVTPPRVVHGDPKINNVVFEAGGDEAVCLVDLDTLGRMALPLELGDALRSWCNLAGEDAARGRFCEAVFAAAVEGYASSAGRWLSDEEVAAIVPATANIQVELAARFCADALNESYFGWDASRFASRSEHNRIRAEGQLAVHADLVRQGRALEHVVAQAFSWSMRNR